MPKGQGSGRVKVLNLMAIALLDVYALVVWVSRLFLFERRAVFRFLAPAVFVAPDACVCVVSLLLIQAEEFTQALRCQYGGLLPQEEATPAFGAQKYSHKLESSTHTSHLPAVLFFSVDGLLTGCCTRIPDRSEMKSGDQVPSQTPRLDRRSCNHPESGQHLESLRK